MWLLGNYRLVLVHIKRVYSGAVTLVSVSSLETICINSCQRHEFIVKLHMKYLNPSCMVKVAWLSPTLYEYFFFLEITMLCYNSLLIFESISFIVFFVVTYWWYCIFLFYFSSMLIYLLIQCHDLYVLPIFEICICILYTICNVYGIIGMHRRNLDKESEVGHGKAALQSYWCCRPIGEPWLLFWFAECMSLEWKYLRMSVQCCD